MTTAVMSGASGVVGSSVLHHLLHRDDVGRVIAVGRRLLPLEHEKLISIRADLQDAAAMAARIPAGVAVALCCLGTTMKQAGSKEGFRAIDHDAVVAFGRAALAQGAGRFLLVSSIGASPRAWTFYARTKGETEEALARLGYAQLTILRPSLLDDVGSRPEYRAGERLALPVARLVFSVAGATSRYAPISVETVATAMVRLAFDHTSERVRVVESEGLHVVGRGAGAKAW